jgi:hypothetical protein
MMNQVFTAFCVSTYLYRQTMTTIKEANETVRLVPWLEFVSTDQCLLSELYNNNISSLPTSPPTEADDDDDYWEKTWLLNKLVCFRRNHFASGVARFRRETERSYHSHSSAELMELRTVPNILRMTLQAALDSKTKFPTDQNMPAVNYKETVWQGETVKLCESAMEILEEMAAKARRAEDEIREREKKHSLSRLERLRGVMGAPKGYGPLVPYVDDAKRSEWSQTGDDGRWVNEKGDVWDEDDHNGMRPFDESGDTDESDGEDDEEGGIPVLLPTGSQSWLGVNLPPPARSR